MFEKISRMYLCHKFYRVKPKYSWLNCSLRHVHVIKPVQKSRSWEVNGFSGSRDILRVVSNTNVHYRIHKRLPLVSILRQRDLVHALPYLVRCEGYSYLLHSHVACTGGGRLLLRNLSTHHVLVKGIRLRLNININIIICKIRWAS